MIFWHHQNIGLILCLQKKEMSGTGTFFYKEPLLVLSLSTAKKIKATMKLWKKKEDDVISDNRFKLHNGIEVSTLSLSLSLFFGFLLRFYHYLAFSGFWRKRVPRMRWAQERCSGFRHRRVSERIVAVSWHCLSEWRTYKAMEFLTGWCWEREIKG